MPAYARFAVSAGLILLFLAGCAVSPNDPNSVGLAGAPNFRDAGGYPTLDGRRVKHGVLFRSEEVTQLRYRDLERFAELGLRRVFDLRHESERKRRPNNFNNAYGLDDAKVPLEGERSENGGASPYGIEVVEIPIYYKGIDRRETRRKILSADVPEGHFKQLFIEANRALALDYTEQWAALLRDLAEPNARPALIHCVEGKDRTGFAVALVLRAVGVSRETVMRDYLLSNKYREPEISAIAFLARVGTLFRVPDREIRPLLEVRPEYLEAAFEAIDERYDSFDNYLRDGLGIDEATLERLRDGLLDRPSRL